MARRKSLLHGMDVIDVVSNAILKRVTASKNAARMYMLKYKAGNPEFAGWILFLADKIERNRAELLRLPPKERSARVQDLVAEASREWESLTSEQKREWIDKAKALLANEKAKLEANIKLSNEIEQLAEEAYKGIEELATVMT